MPSPCRRVTTSSRQASDLGDSLTQAVFLLTVLGEAGVLAIIAQRKWLNRRYGAALPVDVVVYLISFFGAATGIGLRSFYERVRSRGCRLAAVAGRKSLCSSSAVSRALADLSKEQAHAASRELLQLSVVEPALLKDPSVLCYDCHGRGWHMFDYDPIVTAFRRRALPPDKAGLWPEAVEAPTADESTSEHVALATEGANPTEPEGASLPAAYGGSRGAVLASVCWLLALATRPGFSWDADLETVRCPAGEPMLPRTFEVQGATQVLLWRCQSAPRPATWSTSPGRSPRAR